jgi:hypothetical protein
MKKKKNTSTSNIIIPINKLFYYTFSPHPSFSGHHFIGVNDPTNPYMIDWISF